MGLHCTRGLVEKFGEKLVGKSIDILENYLDKVTDTKQNIAISKIFYHMASSASMKILNMITQRLIEINDTYLSHELQEIRQITVDIFVRLFVRMEDKNLINNVMQSSYMHRLHQMISINNIAQSELLIDSLRQMLSVSPELRLEDRILALCNITEHGVNFSVA